MANCLPLCNQSSLIQTSQHEQLGGEKREKFRAVLS